MALNSYVYHRTGEHMLHTLNYAYTCTSSSDDASALASLEDALKSGPVAVGMLDWEESQLYGQLQYASAAHKRDALPALLERLAEQEEKFIAALG